MPIILGIIENVKMGAAKNSAYGYKDAVNKYYMTKSLNMKDYVIQDGEYDIDPQTGYLVGTETLAIEILGIKPDGGGLKFQDNKIDEGCLQFGDYAVSITNENIGNTTKAICDGYEISEGEIADPELVNYTIDETCPGCIFVKNWDDDMQLINQPLTVNTTDSYESYGNLFFGLVVKK